jgi:hypothetical protein
MAAPTKLEPGFYWVKWRADIIVAELCKTDTGLMWYQPGSSAAFSTSPAGDAVVLSDRLEPPRYAAIADEEKANTAAVK